MGPSFLEIFGRQKNCLAQCYSDRSLTPCSDSHRGVSQCKITHFANYFKSTRIQTVSGAQSAHPNIGSYFAINCVVQEFLGFPNSSPSPQHFFEKHDLQNKWCTFHNIFVLIKTSFTWPWDYMLLTALNGLFS